MSAKDWWQTARRLQLEGWKTLAIAAQLGKSENGVRYALNPERAKASQAQYRLRNRERLRDRMRKYRAAHRETHLGLR